MDRAWPPVGAGTAQQAGPAAAGPTVQQVIATFWTDAKGYYVNADGAPAAELDNSRLALIPLRRMYADTAAADFGPLVLKAVRAEMLKPRTVTKGEKTREVPGWSRTYANRQTARLKQVFKWATENELVPPDVYHALAAVAGFRKGKGQRLTFVQGIDLPASDQIGPAVHSASPHRTLHLPRAVRILGCVGPGRRAGTGV